MTPTNKCQVIAEAIQRDFLFDCSRSNLVSDSKDRETLSMRISSQSQTD